MNPMIDQIRSIPGLIDEIIPKYEANIRAVLDAEFCKELDHVYLTGCGDSYHVALCSEMAFEHITQIPTDAKTSMQFARYTADTLKRSENNLVVGASVSGEVSRTVEGLILGKHFGAKTLAFTASPQSSVAKAADIIIDSSQPSFTVPAGLVVPGVRSFVANQIATLLLAIYLGECRETIDPQLLKKLKAEIKNLPEAAEGFIKNCQQLAKDTAEKWLGEKDSVFCGSGPNYGSALFSAAKMIEATGEMSIGQDLEEWAHLQYFSKHTQTPTFVLSAWRRDRSRAKEILTAAKAIGGNVAVVAPRDATDEAESADVWFDAPHGFSEMFTPIFMVIPTSLYAAYRSEALAEPYFRGFSNGRSMEGGGGISRIRTSGILKDLPEDFLP